MSKKIPYKTYLDESELPKQWYNIQADLKDLKPYLNPQTQELVGPADLTPIFPMGLIAQEVSQERYIDIPEEVQEKYKSFRATPLCRAYELEKALGTTAKIYYKYEGVTPSGSHKLNTAIPQVYYNKAEGIKRIATETGAGQWGTALSIAAQMFDIECKVYMVKVSYDQKPYRKSIMETFGAKVTPSPSMDTNTGRAILEADPGNLGSLGIAISEAVEDAATHEDTNYALGSVLNHVILHQTIIGQEAMKQFEKIGDYPDVVIGCCGGGSNYSGIAFPFVKEVLDGKKNTRFTAVEPTACPTLTKGKFTYDFGDTGKFTPLTMMYTLGHDFMPPGIHAGGLRYHGDSPLLSKLVADGVIDAKAVHQTETFDAAIQFARAEGILPAPESAHAIRAAIDEALEAKEKGDDRTILFCLSGHGHFDLTAYEAYNSGKLTDVDYTDEMLAKGFECIPEIK
ncbi:MAG TPA: TrpB-like pyridoxal phosphate-dependent enzyme [Clostridia bacterium]|nr:TrpB-like pyridoxal phosphate-dependent enzyme [Clostridia bacterium]